MTTRLDGAHGSYELSEPVCRQPYLNCTFSTGFVEGHPVDTLYLRFERDGDGATTFLLRPDELAAIAWCATGVLWADHMKKLHPECVVQGATDAD